MPNRQGYTNAAALTEANQIRLLLADPAADPDPIISKLRLFNGTLLPTVNMSQADFEDAETTLVGYPSGGYSITSFAPAVLAPGGGAVILSNMVNVAYASGDSVVIGGWWLEDPDGNVRTYFTFDPQITLAMPGNGFPVV